MIHWAWLLLAFFIGTVCGIYVVGLLAAGRDEVAYRAGFGEGYHEGHVAGFKDGLAEFQKVG